MPALTTYFVEPASAGAMLSFHFGLAGIGVEEAAETWPSDSLFAALVAEAATLEGAPLGSSDPPAFARLFTAALEGRNPPLRFSSLFPRIGSLVLLPRPALSFPDMTDTERRDIGKKFKKLRYVSPAIFRAICAAQPVDPEQLLFLHGGTVWITKAEANTLGKERTAPGLGRHGSENDTQYHNRLAQQRYWKVEQVPRVTVDRVSCASAYYEVGRVVFAPGCGLALLVAYHPTCSDTTRTQFEQVLDLLGVRGIGGRRSIGYGACRFVCQKDQPLMLDNTGAPSRAVLLSRYLPHRDELHMLTHKDASYHLVNVGGWYTSPGHASHQRQQVMLVSEGSVLAAGTAVPIGTIANVRPKEAHGVAHPIYRSGLALTVPVAAQKE